MENQKKIIDYIETKLLEMKKYEERLCLSIIETKDKKLFVKYKGNFYRCYNFIDGGTSFEIIRSPLQFELAGMGFGRFQKYLNGFPADSLYEIIPDFHNTEKRFLSFEKAIKENKVSRKKLCENEIQNFLSRKKYCNTITLLLQNNEIPTRATHNDTKINNLLIDEEINEPLAVLDLDTVMPGSIIYDFGDSIRSGANTAAEDEVELSKVHFSMKLFKAFAKGFLIETKYILTKKEADNLAFGAILMTYECGMRFLTDYLNGDIYFKIDRDSHNLDRARTQLKLVEEMEENFLEMNNFIKELYENKNT